MNSTERKQLAIDLCAALVTRYSHDIIIGGVFGSVARGSDTAWSDLDMLFIVRDGSQIEGKHFIVRDIAVGYEVFERQKWEGLLAKPSLHWPFWMGVLDVLEVLYGEPDQVEAWLELGRAIPTEPFRAVLEESLPELILESYGRIHSCHQRRNTIDIYPAVLEVLYEMNLALCLLNQRWVTHDYYQGLVDAFAFPKLPESYSQLVPALSIATDLDEIVSLADQLVNNFWRLLTAEGIRLKNYQSVADLPL